MRTAQQLFDTAVGALLAQGVRSFDDGMCRYRGPDGTKCAVGHLIPDEVYDEAMESKHVLAVLNRNPQMAEHLHASDRPETFTRPMLRDMQKVHDDVPPENWKRSYMEVAKDYKLEWNFK